MKKTRTSRAVVIVLLLLVIAWVWYQRSGGKRGELEANRGKSKDPTMVLDRLWIDSKPDKYTDYAQVFVAITAAPLGVFQKASAYRATSELFEYKRQGDKIRFYFPQSDKTKQVRFKITSCDELPPFDLCLDLSDNPWGGPKRYYGLTDPGEEEALLGDVRHHLEHHLDVK